MPSSPELAAAQHRRRYYALKAAGRCTHCAAPHAGGTQCARCSRKAAKIKKRHRAAGLCALCWRAKADDSFGDRRLCPPCKVRARAYRRRYEQRRRDERAGESLARTRDRLQAWERRLDHARAMVARLRRTAKSWERAEASLARQSTRTPDRAPRQAHR